MGYLLLFIHLTIATRSSIRILASPHSVTAAWSLLISVWMLPFLGALLYYLTSWHCSPLLHTPKERRVGLESIIECGCGCRVRGGNQVKLLNNASQSYSSLISELQHSKFEIHLLYYIFDDDRIGRAISRILIRKSRAGVKVRIIYDKIGSWMPSCGIIKELRYAGVEIRPFRPLKAPWISSELTQRNHRKIAIIDNRIAYIGGVNIAQRYLDGVEQGFWRDENLRITGAAVEDIQRIFHSDWKTLNGTIPTISSVRYGGDSGVKVQILYSQSGVTRHTFSSSLLSLFISAKREILISTPYFIPPEPHLKILCILSAMGVKVRLMLPAHSDSKVAAAAAESYFSELLNAGVEILRYERGFLHTKMIIVDRKVTYIGTANLDYRSLQSNWEVGAIIYNRKFSIDAMQIFKRDSISCSELTLEEHNSRPLLRKAAVATARLLSPIL